MEIDQDNLQTGIAIDCRASHLLKLLVPDRWKHTKLGRVVF